MIPTEDEIEMLDTLRSLSEHREVQLIASRADGVWECKLTLTPHPLYLVKCPPNTVFIDRGVGGSFVEAFNNLNGNDVEAVGDDDDE